MSRNDIRSSLTYRDYAVLIVHIDSEKFFHTETGTNRTLTSFTKSSDIITAQCAHYRTVLNSYMRKIGGVGASGPKTRRFHHNRSHRAGLANFLYNPVCFTAFGPNDNIAIVAADDFDFLERLVVLSNTSVRQSCLAFSPSSRSIGLKCKDVFCEMHNICDSMPPSGPVTGKHIVAPVHPFVEQRSLLAITYYKLSGLAILGPGLLLQQAVFKAMARTIESVRELLLKKTSKRRGSKLFTDIMSEEDIRSFRCIFLDPQGWSDVVTLMLCRNYSVIATMLQVLRSLKLDDIYDTDIEGVDLRKVVRTFGLPQAMAKVANNTGRAKKHHGCSLLGANHVFNSTYTTLGISHKAFRQDDPKKADNFYNVRKNIVIGDTYLDLCCGHLSEASKLAKQKYRAPFDTPLKSNYTWYLVGAADTSYQDLLGMEHDVGKAVPVFELVQQIKSMRLFDRRKHEKSQASFSTHIHESCSQLRIPTPIFHPGIRATSQGIRLPKIKRQHVELRLILDKVRNKLFEEGLEDLGEGNNAVPKTLSIGLLRRKLRKIRAPRSVANALLSVYTDFSNCVTDTFLFDSVADLYDVFTAAYRLITWDLPLTLDQALKRAARGHWGPKLTQSLEKNLQLASELDAICRSFLTAPDIETLTKIAQMLQNVLDHRVKIGFREVERWNTAVDVRGFGLARMLSSSDALLKCSLGVLRRILDGQTELYHPSDKSENESRSKIGGASNPSRNPRSFSESLKMSKSPENFLISIGLNSSHLTRPHAFYVYFHETAHQIAKILRTKVGCTHPDYECHRQVCCHKAPHVSPERDCRVQFERFEEIFSEMIVHQFVFQEDHKTYFRNYLANYTFDPVAYCEEDENTILRLLEVLLRGFLITDPFRTQVKGQDLYTSKEDPNRLVKEAYRRFWSTLQDAGPFFSEFKRLFQKVNSLSIKRAFTRVYIESYFPICCIWEDVRKIYADICKGKGRRTGLDPDPRDYEGLTVAIKRGLDQGRPLVRTLYCNKKSIQRVEELNYLDAFFLVRHLFRVHIKRLCGPRSINPKIRSVHLLRDHNGGAIFPTNGEKPYGLLLDRTLNDFVCVEPRVRAKSMRDRIVIIKTFWDISTNLRARRMRSILETTLGE